MHKDMKFVKSGRKKWEERQEEEEIGKDGSTKSGRKMRSRCSRKRRRGRVRGGGVG